MIDFAQLRTPKSDTAAAGNGRSDLPKAEFWLNIGYYVDAPTNDDPTAQRFISLPVGIPLDTQEPLKINSQNREFASMQAARNELLAALLEGAQSLAPGEDELVNLQIQVRRVNGAVQVDSATNAFALTDANKARLFGSAD